ncbi:MAG: UDP-N-acetylmuramoyl-L-alanyl-D-glutamate--2,6-diaminopimelate ligase, partial [Clostridia bacterium]
MMLLRELIREVPGLIGVSDDPDTEIFTLASDSRNASEMRGALFFCVSGARVDAHTFAAQVVKAGAVALVVERIVPEVNVPQVQVENVRLAMAHMSAAFFGHPGRCMKLAAVTGTKGKTTTAYLVKAIVEADGMQCGMIGTTGNMIGTRMLPAHLTTPDPIELHRTLREMVDAGAQAVVMEASAHALDMQRLDGLMFDAVAFTNLSQDHLDYFGTMDAYRDTKKRLFTPHYARNAAFNVDDEAATAMMEGVTLPYVTYGIRAECDIYARDIEITENGVSFTLQLHRALETRINLHLTGMFNVYNAMTAAAIGLILGVDMDTIRRGLESVRSVPGRVEVLETHTPYKVILDYSHAPAALENVLKVVRTFARGRVIVLFGCGGDRDREKRPIMGAIGGRLADFSILTSDNPRNEDPYAILTSIEAGMRTTQGAYCVIENRREAIRHALTMARPEDVVILAGKGHETYQEIAGEKHPFDEKVVVRELLEEMDMQ